MKQLLTSLFLIACIQGMGQTKSTKLLTAPSTGSIWVSGDTLFLTEPLQIHFIKIGTEVYQIVQHPVTIEKVQKMELWQQYWPRFESPAGQSGILYLDSIKNRPRGL